MDNGWDNIYGSEEIVGLGALAMSEFFVVFTRSGQSDEIRWRPLPTLEAALGQAADLVRQHNTVRRIEGPMPMTADQIESWIRTNSGR